MDKASAPGARIPGLNSQLSPDPTNGGFRFSPQMLTSAPFSVPTRIRARAHMPAGLRRPMPYPLGHSSRAYQWKVSVILLFER